VQAFFPSLLSILDFLQVSLPVLTFPDGTIILTCCLIPTPNTFRGMAIPRSALLADDEKHIRAYVRIILTHLGVETVLEAKSGNEALELYKEHHPDVVFLDINMPGLTGLEVLPLIVEYDPDAIVIMLTGHASRHLVENTAKAGAIHYIRKDTPQHEISSMLKELFNEVFEDEEE